MSTETVDTVIVGGGQAGLAMSAHLRAAGVDHVVFERERIAERWRTARWDGLVANGPAWHDRFPAKTFDIDGDAFATKDEVVRYFEQFAEEIDAPVRTGVEVARVERDGDGRYAVTTSAGDWRARHVVVATGPFQQPVIPPVIPPEAPVTQLHSHAYRNPEQLDDGAVLVVGSGSSGAQIADELLRAGRDVHLSIGPHDRPPRQYRGKDFVWWLGVLGKWQMKTPEAGREHVTIAVSGAYGGRTIDFREFAERGMHLYGMTSGYAGGCVSFADDLADTLAAGDANLVSLLREADAYVDAHGTDLPPEPDAHRIGPLPAAAMARVRSLDLAAAGIRTVLWATGYVQRFDWLAVDAAFDAKGKPAHSRGVSTAAGVFFLGLPWLSMRGSSFIWGVWEDAAYLAEQIARSGR
ncbi:MAG: NAD(P)/FAD-dependent oxidoreductase [Pseudomonadota bacterium]